MEPPLLRLLPLGDGLARLASALNGDVLGLLPSSATDEVIDTSSDTLDMLDVTDAVLGLLLLPPPNKLSILHSSLLLSSSSSSFLLLTLSSLSSFLTRILSCLSLNLNWITTIWI